MVKIKEIARTSALAWSHDSLPLLATGTVAGAIDINFDSWSALELWEPFTEENEAKVIFSETVENKFYGIEWSSPFEGKKRGLLVGSFENGEIHFWDADKLIQSKSLESALVHKSDRSSGPIKTMQFSPHDPSVLATGGVNGELLIWDTKTFNEPVSPGKATTALDEITSVAWNNVVGHILASTSAKGYASIWDLRSKREVLHLSYNSGGERIGFSSVSWHSNQSTKLITSSDNDNSPVILLWDLRNANAPEKVIQGHQKGILSLDWSKQDPEILLTCGKDNTTILWNPIKAIKLAQYSTATNWVFQTRFAPSFPDIFATASFDGKITVQSIQSTNTGKQPVASNENDFWNEISTSGPEKPVVEHLQAPRWMKNTGSVSFGFGPRIVVVRLNQGGNSEVVLQKLNANDNFKTISERLKEAFRKNDFNSIIKENLEGKLINATDEGDWKNLQKLTEVGANAMLNLLVEVEDQNKDEKTAPSPEKNDNNFTNEDDGLSFFENLSGEKANVKQEETPYVPKGKFHILGDNLSKEDKKLIQLILANKTEEAVDTCLVQNKLTEALVLGLDASENIKLKLKNAYFNRTSSSTFSRVLYSASHKNVDDILENADVSSWKEIAVFISAFTKDPESFRTRITALGDRILQNPSSSESQRDDAFACFVAGGSFDKVLSIWLSELSSIESYLLKSEDPTITSPSDARFRALSNFMEKMAVYRAISNGNDKMNGQRIDEVGSTIIEFCRIVSNNGEYELAEQFLLFLPGDYEGLALERDRIRSATYKYGLNNGGGPQRNSRIPTLNTMGPTQTNNWNKLAGAGVATGPSTYNRDVPRPSSRGLEKHNVTQSATSNPYVKTQQNYAPVAPSMTRPYSQNSLSGSLDKPVPTPPQAPFQPSYKRETDGWNDLPDTFKPRAPQRRAAPAAVISPASTPPAPAAAQAFPNAPGRTLSSASVAPPPPPKGPSRSGSTSAMPKPAAGPSVAAPSSSRMSSRYAPTPSAPEVPPVMNSNGFGSSTATLSPRLNATQPAVPAPPKNPYAPPQGAAPATSARSPYAPPMGTPTPQQPVPLPPVGFTPKPKAPARNPYAPQSAAASPSVGAQSSIPLPPKVGPVPPQGGVAPAPPVQPGLGSSMPFGPPRPSGSSSHIPMAPPPTSSYAPPPPAAGGSVAPPPPAAGGSVAPPPATGSVAQPPASVSAHEEVSKEKYPPGDRSHIPESSQPIYQCLSRLLDGVLAKIPAQYQLHGKDTEKRLNFLFDHLNNSELLSDDTLSSLNTLCGALDAGDFTSAKSLSTEIAVSHPEEIGNWHRGLTRLIQMLEAF